MGSRTPDEWRNEREPRMNNGGTRYDQAGRHTGSPDPVPWWMGGAGVVEVHEGPLWKSETRAMKTDARMESEYRLYIFNRKTM